MATPRPRLRPGEAARRRREARVKARIEWLGERVKKGIKIGMRTRRGIAAQLLVDKTKINIGKPVKKVRRRSKTTGKFLKQAVDRKSRSKPGEFPRLETATLQRSIFWQHRGKKVTIIGTSLDYGLVLETRMNRSFLRRTFKEERRLLTRILTEGTGASVRFPGEE